MTASLRCGALVLLLAFASGAGAQFDGCSFGADFYECGAYYVSSCRSHLAKSA